MRDNILNKPPFSTNPDITNPQINNAMESDFYGFFRLFDYIALSPRIRHEKETI